MKLGLKSELRQYDEENSFCWIFFRLLYKVKELNAETREITLVFGEKNDSMEMLTYDRCLLATGSS